MTRGKQPALTGLEISDLNDCFPAQNQASNLAQNFIIPGKTEMAKRVGGAWSHLLKRVD